MSDLPDRFKCTITNWDYLYDLCWTVSDDVKASEFEPDIVVALARGGWFAGRVLCDFLGLDDLTSLKVEHYVGTAQASGNPEIRYPMPEGSVTGKDVLIIDDIADTGGSIRRADEYVRERDVGEVRTATLQLLGTSDFEPDYVGERLEEWTWIVYPWNFIEDLIEITEGVMEKAGENEYTLTEIRHYLNEFHDIERISMEIAQPNRLPEVLSEMYRRGIVDRDDDAWSLT